MSGFFSISFAFVFSAHRGYLQYLKRMVIATSSSYVATVTTLLLPYHKTASRGLVGHLWSRIIEISISFFPIIRTQTIGRENLFPFWETRMSGITSRRPGRFPQHPSPTSPSCYSHRSVVVERVYCVGGVGSPKVLAREETIWHTPESHASVLGPRSTAQASFYEQFAKTAPTRPRNPEHRHLKASSSTSSIIWHPERKRHLHRSSSMSSVWDSEYRRSFKPLTFHEPSIASAGMSTAIWSGTQEACNAGKVLARAD